MTLLLPLVLAGSLAVVWQEPCITSPDAPALDHVVLVVRDLERASAAFRGQGFRIKSGRLHANNLLNRHVKFRDGTSLELMSVAGRAGDEMAADYERLLLEGERAVYAALSVANVAGPERIATTLGLTSRRSSSGPWQFLSFPLPSPAAAVFFSAGGSPVHDPDSLVAHSPEVAGLSEVWIEGGSGLKELLRQLGARPCGTSRSPDGREGERWALRRGSAVIVPERPGHRPRILGVALSSRQAVRGARFPVPSFWIRYSS
jgi:glyoxalase-like protein